MADSYSTNLRLIIQTTGENSGTWGTKTNTNLNYLDAKLGNTTTVTETSGTKTLSETEERVARIHATGTLTGNLTIEFSGRKGYWIVRNGTSGTFSLTCKVTGQTGVTVTQGYSALVYCNGTDIEKCIEQIDASAFATITGGAWAAEAAVADSATPAIGAAASYRVVANGTTTVTGFDSVAAGIWRVVRWAGARTLTNGASLILIGGANRTTAAGDTSIFRSEGSGVWREEFAMRATGKAIVGPASTDITDSTATGRSVLTAASAAAGATALGLGTGDSPQFTAINVGHASDTTVARYAAGIVGVEGVALHPGIPITDKSAAYTLVLGDAQTAIRHPASDNNARTFTIPANASVAYPVGTCLTFINEVNTVTIAINSDTLVLAGSGTTGSRTLAANGVATAVKVASTRWYISGSGIS
jgi:hypothetical protein